MTARVLKFPPRGPFAVDVQFLGSAWLVTCRDHGWLHDNRRDANAEAVALACGFGVAVKTSAEEERK